MDETPSPWFADGLRFACTRCGACCTGTPGYVWVSAEEIDRLAERLDLSVEQFGTTYLRQVGSRLSLVEKTNFECIFWDRESGCTVYEHRPDQCRTWPFWSDNLQSPEDWRRVQRSCPGTGRGQLFTVEQITAAVARSPK